MLALSTRFALMTLFCGLAALTCRGVGAAAVKSRSFDQDHCSDVSSDRLSAQYVLSLPLRSKAKQSKVRTHEWLLSNPIALLADIAFARLKRGDTTPRIACKIRKRGDYSEPANIARRSVLIPDHHGSEYIVSHSRRRPVHQRQRRHMVRMLSRTKETPLSRHAQDVMVGNVVLVSPVHGSTTGRQIAALYAAPKAPGAWTLYASETNQTQFQLVNASDNVEETSDLVPMTLEMGTVGDTRTCATYNSNPPQDESDTEDENMTMEPCINRATPETVHKSQIFMYNSTSGTLEPIWNSDTDGANAAAVNSPVNQNSTTSSNATTSSSSVLAAATLFANREDIPPNPTKQNPTVTLVFAPVQAMVADVGTQQNSTGVAMTVTKTVTVFNVESTSAGVSSSTSNAAVQATATSSALDVQLVGAPMPSNVAGSTTMGPSSASTSSSAATGSIDAAAVASRIAASASASSASAAASSIMIGSSTDNASPSSTQVAQRRSNGRLAASDSEVTTPYTWMFKAEER